MTDRHTPGPWIPDLGEVYRVRSQQDGGQIAIMMNLKGAGLRAGDEVAANARLIAAAPDLLEALGNCVSLLSAYTNDDAVGIVILEQARSAIAKAKGE